MLMLKLPMMLMMCVVIMIIKLEFMLKLPKVMLRSVGFEVVMMLNAMLMLMLTRC